MNDKIRRIPFLAVPAALAMALAGVGVSACGDGTLTVTNYYPEGEGQEEPPGEEGLDEDAGGGLDEEDAGLPPDPEDAGVVVVPDSGEEGDDAGEIPEEDAWTPPEPEPEDAWTPPDPEPEDAGSTPDPEPEDAWTPPEPDPLAWVPACSSNCPTVIESLPYTHQGNTSGKRAAFDRYSCASGTSEAGPEETYVFHVTEPGIVIAGVTEPSKGDVDVHLLSSLSTSACISRGDKGVSSHVDAGVYYLSLDTFESSTNAGSYGLSVIFLPDSGKCGLNVFNMDRVNSSAPLPMPATGKVVKEAHLVTKTDQKENGGASWWPSSSTQYLSTHKSRTATLTGISYNRTESWAPAGEGNCQYGQGSTGAAVPDDAEAWYVCMYWKGAHKPKAGTKYLVVNPATGKAVVAAAGYETGPGDAAKIGGAVEEIHHVLGTSHGGTLTFGELKNQSLSYGVVECQ